MLGVARGIDSLIAARMVGPTGEVVGVDMTPAMLDRARTSAERVRLLQRPISRGTRGIAARSRTAGRTS